MKLVRETEASKSVKRESSIELAKQSEAFFSVDESVMKLQKDILAFSFVRKETGKKARSGSCEENKKRPSPLRMSLVMLPVELPQRRKPFRAARAVEQEHLVELSRRGRHPVRPRMEDHSPVGHRAVFLEHGPHDVLDLQGDRIARPEVAWSKGRWALLVGFVLAVTSFVGQSHHSAGTGKWPLTVMSHGNHHSRR